MKDNNELMKFGHAAVFKGHFYRGEDLVLTIKNSLAGQKVFGENIQPSEHNIEHKAWLT